MGNNNQPVIIHVSKDSVLERECWQFVEKHFPEIYQSFNQIKKNSYWDLCLEFKHFEKMEFHIFKWVRLTCPETRNNINSKFISQFKRLEINASNKVCTTVDIVPDNTVINTSDDPSDWNVVPNQLVTHKSINTRFIAANCDCNELSKIFFDRVQDFEYD